MTTAATIHVGDSLEVLATLPDESVHCCVTSPPYWNLRDYGVDGQMGSEDSFDDYLDNLVAVFEQVRRVLRSDGTLWLNLGDSYAGQGGGNDGKHTGLRRWREEGRTGSKRGFKRKDLIGVPWRVAFALQEAGWWLRSDVVWHKPNAMPDSAADRPARAHEFVFLLAKSASYFYDDLAVRSPHKREWLPYARTPRAEAKNVRRESGLASCAPSGFGARMRDVWTITSKPYRDAHFATFPPDLVQPCLRAGTSEHGVCEICASPFERVVERGDADLDYQRACGGDANGEYSRPATKDYGSAKAQDAAATKARILARLGSQRTVDWRPTCDCAAGHGARAVVLDPFSGAGTTGVVALELGLHYVGIELNPAYARQSRRRLADVAPLFVDIEMQEASA